MFNRERLVLSLREASEEDEGDIKPAKCLWYNKKYNILVSIHRGW